MSININKAYEIDAEPKLWAKLYRQAAKDFAREISFFPRCPDGPRQKIAILSHENPDGDAIGATLGLYHMLKKKQDGKTSARIKSIAKPGQVVLHRNTGHDAMNGTADVIMINPGPIPQWLNFLPGIKFIKRPDELPPGYVPDCAVVLDVPDEDKLGAGKRIFDAASRKIWIDHHQYKDTDWQMDEWLISKFSVIDSRAGACCEMLSHIFYYYSKYASPSIHSALKQELNRDAATALAIGLHADTGGLRWSGTNCNSSLALATLQRAGANWTDISSSISQRSWAEQKFVAHFINDNASTFEKDGKLVWCVLKQREIMRFGVGDEVTPWTSNVLYQLEQVPDVQMVVMFIELPNNVTCVRIRSNYDWLPVDDFAKFFPPEFCTGKGHKKASGYKIFHGANGFGIREAARLFLDVVKREGKFR